jgi:hypothetical protein
LDLGENSCIFAVISGWEPGVHAPAGRMRSMDGGGQTPDIVPDRGKLKDGETKSLSYDNIMEEYGNRHIPQEIP